VALAPATFNLLFLRNTNGILVHVKPSATALVSPEYLGSLIPICNLQRKETVDLFPKEESVATRYQLLETPCCPPWARTVHSIGGRGEKVSRRTVLTRGQRAHVCTDELGDRLLAFGTLHGENEWWWSIWHQKIINVVDRLGNEKGFSIGVSWTSHKVVWDGARVYGASRASPQNKVPLYDA
jgi:hypothetical protein